MKFIFSIACGMILVGMVPLVTAIILSIPPPPDAVALRENLVIGSAGVVMMCIGLYIILRWREG